MKFLAAELANPQALWEKILSFLTDFDAMFPGFTGVVEKAQKPFFLIAFVLIVYHLIKRASGAGSRESQLRAIASATVFSLLVALCNKEANLVKSAFTAIEAEMGATSKTPKLIEQKKEEMIVALTKGIEDKSGSGAGDDKGSLYYLTHWSEAFEKGIEGIVPSIGGLMIQLGSYVLIFWCKLASVIAWGFWLVQQFLFQFSLIFLPAMIAMIAIGGLSSIGTRYVMSMVGILSWPMGWGFVNVGTEAMLTSVVNTLRSAGASDYELTTYLWAYAICSVIPLWIILGYCFVPFVIQRMVTSGANAAQGLIGQAAGAAIGAAALGAGFVAASGGSPTPSGSNTTGTSSDGGSESGEGNGGGGGRNPQRAAAAAMGAIAAISPLASAPFDQLAQDAGATPMGGGANSAMNAATSDSGDAPSMESRIQQSQAMAAHTPPPMDGLTPSSAAARDEVERRRGSI